MPTYANRGGDSSVVSYETGPGWITVTFRDGAEYLYTDASTGPRNILGMISRAERGQGLNGFISSYIKKAYARKLK